jgi:transcription elongation factor Elf1
MGKRKSSKKVMKKERPKVMSKAQFDCPNCNHAGSIKVTM